MIQGSQLEKLHFLRRRIDDEIRQEEQRLRKTRKKAAAKKRRSPSGPTAEQRAAELGLTAHQVKEWALSQGLIDRIRNGRLSGQLLDQYIAGHIDNHHPNGDTDD